MRTLILILAIAALGCCKMASQAQTVEIPRWSEPKILPQNDPKSKKYIPRKKPVRYHNWIDTRILV